MDRFFSSELLPQPDLSFWPTSGPVAASSGFIFQFLEAASGLPEAGIETLGDGRSIENFGLFKFQIFEWKLRLLVNHGALPHIHIGRFRYDVSTRIH
jgi:hypothetical protein